MALPLQDMALENIARRVETVDIERARAYAAATNDANPAYAEGLYAPPVFGVVPTWEPMITVVRDEVPAESLGMLLHAEQDMRWLRPLAPGLELHTGAELYSRRVLRSGTWLTVRVESVDGDAEPVLEQFATMFVRGLVGGEDSGPERPAHGFPAEARSRPVAEGTVHVDADQTFRYRDASGDDNAIHVDDEFARSVNLPGIILHGLCTMAMCGSVVVDRVLGGDPARLARLAVRFSKPVFPGSDVSVTVFEAGGGAYAFEARSDDRLVIRDGRAEVRS
ncbi:MAG TPA: MaoC/PaaZ C-terminal domain-containing protein [Acidimicrobiales bacterium]